MATAAAIARRSVCRDSRAGEEGVAENQHGRHRQPDARKDRPALAPAEAVAPGGDQHGYRNAQGKIVAPALPLRDGHEREDHDRPHQRQARPALAVGPGLAYRPPQHWRRQKRPWQQDRERLAEGLQKHGPPPVGAREIPVRHVVDHHLVDEPRSPGRQRETRPARHEKKEGGETRPRAEPEHPTPSVGHELVHERHRDPLISGRSQ